MAVAKSVHRLGELIEARLDTVKLVSFDVFDTLLTRRVDPPEMIHERVAEAYSRLLEGSLSPLALLEVRRAAERALRSRSVGAGLDPECSYDDLISSWVNEVEGHPCAHRADALRAIELELETIALSPKPGIEAILASLVARGVPLIAASDMYLGSDHIKKLLDAKGLAKYFCHIYVSSDKMRCKGSGRLFLDILERHGCEPSEVLHIGDNHVSDYKVPGRHGLEVIHLWEPDDLKRRAMLRHYRALAARNIYWRGRHLVQVAGGVGKQDEHAGFYYRFGRDILGPVFCAFTLRLIERLAELRPSVMFFAARDGFLLQDLYNRMCAALGVDVVENVYLCVSRKVAFAASVADGLAQHDAAVALNNPQQRGLYSILKAFGLPVEAFADLAARHGISDIEEPLADRHDARLVAFLEDDEVQLKIRGFGRSARDVFEGYLEARGFFSADRVALVDIGWNGTIQYALQRLPRWREGGGDLWGLYFGFCAGIGYEFDDKSHVEGLWYDERRKNAAERVTVSYEEVFEESARAAHGTTIGYTMEDGTIRPVFKPDDAPDRREEVLCNPNIADLQRGVLEFCDEFCAAVRLTGYSGTDIHPFFLTLMERAVAYPREDEVRSLSALAHSEDFGHDAVMDFSDLGRRRLWFVNPRQYIRALKRSHWRYGFLKGLPRVMYRLGAVGGRW